MSQKNPKLYLLIKEYGCRLWHDRGLWLLEGSYGHREESKLPSEIRCNGYRVWTWHSMFIRHVYPEDPPRNGYLVP